MENEFNTKLNSLNASVLKLENENSLLKLQCDSRVDTGNDRIPLRTRASIIVKKEHSDKRFQSSGGKYGTP